MMTLDWTLLAAAVVFLLTLWALNSLLFRPLLKAIDERSRLTEGVRREAVSLQQQRQELLEGCGERIKQEKLRGYQHAESVRRQSLEERRQRLLRAREESERELETARSLLRQEVEDARKLLAAEAREAADLLTARLLQKT